MAAINAIAREWADEIRDGIAWVLIWKTGRSWNAHAVWLNSDDDTFEPEDLELARKVLEQDPKAVMARLAGKCMDAMLYNANDHPKWWHYYKHAKKYRVRKKYRRRLERQLCDKLLAAAAG